MKRKENTVENIFRFKRIYIGNKRYGSKLNIIRREIGK